MNDVLVTVVVPIYKIEKYLSRCVESIINQTYKNLEIILVDDGSPDNCPGICDDFAKKDSRIKVVHKQNAGLGKARNTGIDCATGKYICFFDGDDYVESNAIELCVLAAIENNAELVVFGHDDVTNEGVLLANHVPNVPKHLFLGEEVKKILLPASLCSNQEKNYDWDIGLSAWNKFYSLDVIKNSRWRFVSERDIISEDYYSLTELHNSLNRVFILDEILYHYVVNNASLSRTFKPDRFERIKGFHQAMLSLSKKMELEDALNQAINSITFGLLVAALKQIAKSELKFCRRYQEIKKIIKDPFSKELVKSTDCSKAGFQKKLFYNVIKSRLYLVCFALVSLKK